MAHFFMVSVLIRLQIYGNLGGSERGGKEQVYICTPPPVVYIYIFSFSSLSLSSSHKFTTNNILLSKESYLVDPASSHMLVSKIKPCMSKYKQLCTVKLRMAH